MDAGLTLGIAVITFIIGIIIKYATGFDFNKFLGALGAMAIVIPMIIAIAGILKDPSNTEVAKNNIEFFVESFMTSLPGVIIGDIAALIVASILEAFGIKT